MKRGTSTSKPTKAKTQIGGACQEAGCNRPHYGRGYCKAHHQWRWKRGLISAASTTIKEKIEMYAVPVTESGCWLWSSTTNNNGYGRISVGGQKSMYAHRAAYAEYVGPIADGLHVCHKCDTPACCNPSHLFLGTAEQNMRDASRKGRARTTPRYGDKHHNAKFSSADVSLIRASTEAPRALAIRYGCNVETIYRARRGSTYPEGS